MKTEGTQCFSAVAKNHYATRRAFVGLLGALVLWALVGAHAASSISSLTLVPRLTIQSALAVTNQIQYSTDPGQTNWTVLTNLVVTQSPYWFADVGAPPSAHRFYRVLAFTQTNFPPAPTNMVLIPIGTFVMGSPEEERMRNMDEVQHSVTLPNSFYMGKYPVTQGQYLAVVGSNPSFFKTNAHGVADLNRPVETVSWSNATNYCALLTQTERVAGRISTNWAYRLPTEAEREYACRAGTTTAFHFGRAIHAGLASFNFYYEYDAITGEIYIPNPVVPELTRPTPVGVYAPNAFGLYDMHGNIWEWCQDWYGPYPNGTVIDPRGAPAGSTRVIRGGSFGNDGSRCRSAVRDSNLPTNKNNYTGFRVVLAPVQP